MANNLLKSTFEDFEKGVGQQASLAGQTAVASVTGIPPAGVTGEATKSGDSKDTQDMVNALYGPSQPQDGQPQQSSGELQAQTSNADAEALEKTRQQMKMAHQKLHNEVYANKFNPNYVSSILNPQAQKPVEKTKQDELEEKKKLEEQEKQKKLAEEKKKEEKIKAPPSKDTAERERKLGG